MKTLTCYHLLLPTTSKIYNLTLDCCPSLDKDLMTWTFPIKGIQAMAQTDKQTHADIATYRLT